MLLGAAAGVLAGLEVIRCLNDAGHVTKRPIVVVDWTNEEGARFSPPMVASGCFVGKYDIDWVHDLIGDDGGLLSRSPLGQTEFGRTLVPNMFCFSNILNILGLERFQSSS